MIKLTTSEGYLIFINPSEISTIEESDSYRSRYSSFMRMRNGDTCHIMESPGEIMRKIQDQEKAVANGS